MCALQSMYTQAGNTWRDRALPQAGGVDHLYDAVHYRITGHKAVYIFRIAEGVRGVDTKSQ